MLSLLPPFSLPPKRSNVHFSQEGGRGNGDNLGATCSHEAPTHSILIWNNEQKTARYKCILVPQKHRLTFKYLCVFLKKDHVFPPHHFILTVYVRLRGRPAQRTLISSVHVWCFLYHTDQPNLTSLWSWERGGSQGSLPFCVDFDILILLQKFMSDVQQGDLESTDAALTESQNGTSGRRPEGHHHQPPAKAPADTLRIGFMYLGA